MSGLDPRLLARIGDLYADDGEELTFVPVATWTSRTACLHRLTASKPGVADVVLKVRDDWDAAAVKRSHEEHRLWADALRRAGVGDRVLVPRTRWLADPPLLCMDLVEGKPLGQTVATLAETSEGGGVTSGEIAGILHDAGAALAAYHDAPTLEPAPDAAVGAVEDIAAVVARLRLPRVVRRRLCSTARPVTSAADFAPYNLHVSPDHTVHVLDPSLGRQVVTRHRNVGWFLFWFHHRLRDSPRALRRAAERAFLEGYAEISGIDLGSGDDRRLVDAFLTEFGVRRLRRAFRSGPRRAIRALGWTIGAWNSAAGLARTIGGGHR